MTTDQRKVVAETGLYEGTFAIGTLNGGQEDFPAIIKADGQVIDVSKHFVDTHAIFDDWDANFDKLSEIAAKHVDDGKVWGEFKARPPLAHPNLLCAGANYKTHVIEMMSFASAHADRRLPGESDEDFWQRNTEFVEKRAREGKPFVWTALHSAMNGANDDIPLSPVGEQHDWELELVAVIGRRGRHVSREDAVNMIAGYAVGNDLGTMDTATRDDVPFKWDFLTKNQWGFKVVGPFIVPRQFFDYTADVKIQLWVNGETKQDWPVNDMIFPPEALVSYASGRVRLLPGDMIFCGSPPGNAAYLGGRFLQDGDLMEAQITGLGRQRNRCVKEVVGG